MATEIVQNGSWPVSHQRAARGIRRASIPVDRKLVAKSRRQTTEEQARAVGKLALEAQEAPAASSEPGMHSDTR